MPDITMCRTNTCILKEQCYRYTATPSQWQSMSEFPAATKEHPHCQYFWDNQQEEQHEGR